MARKSLLFVLVLALTAGAFAQAKPGAAKLTVGVQQSADTPALPAGTVVKMKLETALSSAVTPVGTEFAGRVTEDVSLAGQVVIPIGSSIKGKVVRAESKRRYKGRPVLELRPETVTTPNGDIYNMIAVVVKTDSESGTKVDDEGRIMGSTLEKRDKIEMAAGAGAGLGIGALAGGGKGSLIGAAIGGGGAVVYWLTKNKNANLLAGTEIVMELDRPVTLTSTSAD